MSEQIDAIYDHGVLRPLAPLALPENSRVTLTVDTLSDHKSAELGTSQNAVGREDKALAAEDEAAGFGAGLDALLFDGPSLPPDFSRADIYADHD